MANITIYDVAGAARVSLATVSRVINNPEKVNFETRERVLKVIKELGYHPNAIARGLASRKSTTVGVIVSDVTRASTSQTLGGIMNCAKKLNYTIKLFSMPADCDIEDTMGNVVAEQIDGLLILNDELDQKGLDIIKKKVNESTIPVVFCNVLGDKDFSSVNIDYAQAAYEVTKEMIERGRKSIYLLSQVRHYGVNDEKERGYVKAMNESNLEPLIFRTSADLEINTPHFIEYFKDKVVDGAIAVRDSMAVSFMNSLTDQKRRVPEDTFVVGFQNTKYAYLSRPRLSCVSIPVYEIGAQSMELLTKLIRGEEIEDKKIILPHGFVHRDSM